MSVTLSLWLSPINAVDGQVAQVHQAKNVPLGAPTTQRQAGAQPAKAAAPQSGAQSGKTPAAGTNAVPLDTGRAIVGGCVYSTGTDDVILKVLTPAGLPYPSETITTVINGLRVSVANPNVSAWVDEIAIVVPGPARVLATNKQYDRTVNLGRLPAGEIIFAIRTPDGNFFKTGDGSRNGDGRVHAIVKTFLSGVMQVWFEDQPGSGGPNDWDCNDAVFQLSGGVADNNAVAELTKVIKEQKGTVQEQAIEALKQINPKALSLALRP